MHIHWQKVVIITKMVMILKKPMLSNVLDFVNSKSFKNLSSPVHLTWILLNVCCIKMQFLHGINVLYLSSYSILSPCSLGIIISNSMEKHNSCICTVQSSKPISRYLPSFNSSVLLSVHIDNPEWTCVSTKRSISCDKFTWW